MSMHCLSQEIISKIIFLVIDQDPSDHDWPVGKQNGCLAAVSRTWQAVVEMRTFRNITLRQHDLAEAARIITLVRQPLVHTVNIDIQLDDYNEGTRWRVESPAEQQRNSEVYTAAVRGVFNLIQGWEKPSYGDGLDLKLHVWSPSDINRLSPEAAEDMVRRLPFSPLRRYEGSVIRFLEGADALPGLKHVVDLEIQQFPVRSWQGRELYRAVDPASASLIISKCTNLRRLKLHLMDWPRGALEERKRRRKTIAAAIDRLPQRLQELRFAYWASPPRDEKCVPPSLLSPGEDEDALSLSLRRFWRRPGTRALNISCTILGQEFFWPKSEGDNDEDAGYNSDDHSWLETWDRHPSASLEQLRVDWPILTPDGRWLYERPRAKIADQVAWEESDIRDDDATDLNDNDAAAAVGPTDPDPELDDAAYTNMHRFRIAPVRGLINPLLKAMARAMGQMPALADFEWVHPGNWPANRVQYNPNFDDGGGNLGFDGFGLYDADEQLIDMGEPLLDEGVVQAFTEVLSAREPKGKVEVTIE
ncbi:hypothetical protein C8A00DRAFT_34306 [Chaetomidium leptoderma]|uniref:F-box domain-containing protein n=1 Tax=Chaetomidium leptoderma TaxID=669021 RepID=A0AAN6VKS7_9PEZI|nr:hypothetical protein C8A00DRAFT_34306 [Chaetomidium leptoderma]